MTNYKTIIHKMGKKGMGSLKQDITLHNSTNFSVGFVKKKKNIIRKRSREEL